MILTNQSRLVKLGVDQNVYQWVNNNFESQLLVCGDINLLFKDIDKSYLEKIFYSLLKVGVLNLNAEMLKNLLIHNPTFEINGVDKNFQMLVDSFMLNFAEITEVSKVFGLEISNLALTGDEGDFYATQS